MVINLNEPATRPTTASTSSSSKMINDAPDLCNMETRSISCDKKADRATQIEDKVSLSLNVPALDAKRVPSDLKATTPKQGNLGEAVVEDQQNANSSSEHKECSDTLGNQLDGTMCEPARNERTAVETGSNDCEQSETNTSQIDKISLETKKHACQQMSRDRHQPKLEPSHLAAKPERPNLIRRDDSWQSLVSLTRVVGQHPMQGKCD